MLVLVTTKEAEEVLGGQRMASSLSPGALSGLQLLLSPVPRPLEERPPDNSGGNRELSAEKVRPLWLCG